MPKNVIYRYLALGLLTALIISGSISYTYSPTIQERNESLPEEEPRLEVKHYEGDHVVVLLDDMRLELRNGTTTLKSMDLLSKGKPGSYYETIGGAYENDYKIKSHYSTLGEVYLPWSVHVFGNYFIHGVPYYKDGRKVSSAYSGGCIRLNDENAKRVYDFVSLGTPIIVTGENIDEWNPTATSTDTFTSMDMTRYMAVIISLEVLKQDENIRGTDGKMTTRKELIPRILEERDDGAILTLAKERGNETFTMYMNKKANSLGLSNTAFQTVNGPATTTPEEYARLMDYVTKYKSYLVGISSSTPTLAR